MEKLVLTIDDDKLTHLIIEESLAGFCKLLHAKEGEEGLRLINEHKPDIILLDIEMPGKSGYQVCQEIKQNADTKDIPVMFLSSKEALIDRVKGYSVGASDYIMKPFNAQELMARIKILYAYRQQCVKLESDINKANKTAAMAMTESGDMGRIMRYVGQSYHANSLQTLSEFFLGFFTPLNLDVVVVFWYQHKSEFYSLQGGVCPLVQELLAQHKDAQRFVDIGESTIINYPKLSLLVKNMPVDESEKYGRYKDLFPHILEVTNEKVVTMERNEKNYQQAEQISTALEDIISQFNAQNITQSNVAEQFCTQLEALNTAIELQKNNLNPADFDSCISELEHTMQLLVSANSDLAFIKYQFEQVTQSRSEFLQSLRHKVEDIEPAINQDPDIELF